MRKKHARRAASEVEKTSRPRLAIDWFQRSLTWWHRDRTRKMIERSAAGVSEFMACAFPASY